MITQEQISVSNILKAAKNQISETLSAINRFNDTYRYDLNGLSPEKMNRFASQIVEGAKTTQELLMDMKEYPFWNDGLRKSYRFRINCTLQRIKQDAKWVSEFASAYREIRSDRRYGPQAVHIWKEEWDETVGKDLPALIRDYIALLDQIIERTAPQQLQKRGLFTKQKAIHFDVPVVCSHCGVKIPAGRTACLRCQHSLSE